MGHLPSVIDTNIGNTCPVDGKLKCLTNYQLWLTWGQFTPQEKIQIHTSLSFSPQEFSSFRCFTCYTSQWVVGLRYLCLLQRCPNTAFLRPLDFPPVPTSFLLDVNRCFGCVEKEKDLHQTANKWPFSAEYLFIWQLGTGHVGIRDNWVELDFAEPREELRALQAALCAWAIPHWLCPWIHIWHGPSWISHPSHFFKEKWWSITH